MKNILKNFNTGFRVVTRDDKNSQRAAMFGLDARVALAIFGALSVITGAALYEAMKKTKVIALLTEFDNINKAVTQYLLDTGSYLPADTTNATVTNNGNLNMKELVSSSVTGWKGPYISFPLIGSDTYRLSHPNYSNIYIYRKQDSSWDYPGSTASTCLFNTPSCSIYICIAGIGISEYIQNNLDIKIDGVIGADSGNFRYTGNYACKKGMPYDKNLSPVSIP